MSGELRVIACLHRVFAGAAMLALALAAGCQHSELSATAPDAAQPDLAMVQRHDFATPRPWPDFPSEPVIDTSNGMTPNAPSLFAVPGEPTGGPCIVEPEAGTIMPLNWIRPRVRFVPVAGQNLFEIRLHADGEENDLVVYTAQTTWTMSINLWKALTAHVVGEPITVTVRGAEWDGVKLAGPPQAAAPSSFQVAPVPVTGSIVYSSASGPVSVLRGAEVGSEQSRVVLRASSVGAQCIGCHAATPDAVHVGFVQSQDASTGTRPSLGVRTTDGLAAEPAYLTAAARLLLATPDQDGVAFTRSHYNTGDRLMLSARPVGDHTELVWTDLEAASVEKDVGWGVLLRDGDNHDASMPVFSHDGTFVLYVSGSRATGNQGIVDGNLLTVPWSSRLGGFVSGVPGARESRWNEYAPSLSPDDRFIAFARVPIGETSQANIHAEIAVLPTGGGDPKRIEANDPPACTGSAGIGAGNSWPRFSPDALRVDSTTWYWVVFSSKRGPKHNAQIYISAVKVDESNEQPVISSSPALYLWSQPPDNSNHTPSWELLHLAAE